MVTREVKAKEEKVAEQVLNLIEELKNASVSQAKEVLKAHFEDKSGLGVSKAGISEAGNAPFFR